LSKQGTDLQIFTKMLPDFYHAQPVTMEDIGL